MLPSVVRTSQVNATLRGEKGDDPSLIWVGSRTRGHTRLTLTIPQSVRVYFKPSEHFTPCAELEFQIPLVVDQVRPRGRRHSSCKVGRMYYYLLCWYDGSVCRLPCSWVGGRLMSTGLWKDCEDLFQGRSGAANQASSTNHQPQTV